MALFLRHSSSERGSYLGPLAATEVGGCATSGFSGFLSGVGVGAWEGFWESFPAESGRTLSSMTISPSDPGESGAEVGTGAELGAGSRQGFLATTPSPLVFEEFVVGFELSEVAGLDSLDRLTPAMTAAAEELVVGTGAAVEVGAPAAGSFLISSTILFLT